jgi:hypothetical protein
MTQYIDGDLEAARIAQDLDPSQQVQLQIMQVARWLPTWSSKLTELGLVNPEGGLLTELGERVATWLMSSQ